ncbi:hypothetical protein GCM10022247_10470 [Allokutzneria multivorans]|uniref:DUF2975 domain-containing protein n=1 Tax=Allokutzneria multivorans TaxID=1142134 RepID=A0ABP7R711_9PSEU
MAQKNDPLDNPAEPAAAIVRVLLVLVGVGYAVSILLAVFGIGSFHPFGSDQLCEESSGVMQRSLAMDGLRPGTEAHVLEIRFCAEPVTGEQRVLWGVANHLGTLLNIGLLVFAYRLVSAVRDSGLHTALTARRLRVLGWLLVLGCAAASLIETAARSAFLSSVLDPARYSPAWYAHWEFPVWPLILGCVLLSLARIIRIGSEMQKDLEGTV